MQSTESEIKDVLEILGKSNLPQGKKIKVITTLNNARMDEYPFIKRTYVNGEVVEFKSEIPEIKNYVFNTEREVILVNAIYENVKENFEHNTFVQLFQFTFRILGIDSPWSKL